MSLDVITEVQEMNQTFDQLWPLPRSITGDGLRESLDVLDGIMPTMRHEIPTGTRAFDWTIPQEWRVRDAYVADPNGRRLIDWRENHLHLVNYSVPFRGTLTREQLEEHLYTHPDGIPYVTSYYEPRWGFCLSHDQRRALGDGPFDVVVDTELFDGHLTIGEAVLPATVEYPSGREVLFTSYLCHPSMANNELCGPIAVAYLYRRLAGLQPRRHQYRFVLAPETIGSIAYLRMYGDRLLDHLLAGYVLTCIGAGPFFHYKQSRRTDSLADRAAAYVLAKQLPPWRETEFDPSWGSDERQYCSPGFDLPVGVIMRSVPGRFPEYHTSLDSRNLVSMSNVRSTLDVCEQIVVALEQNQTYTSTHPFGEPQLGRRGLYPTLGGPSHDVDISALMWVLNYSEWAYDLLKITELSGHSLERLAAAASIAVENGLLKSFE